MIQNSAIIELKKPTRFVTEKPMESEELKILLAKHGLRKTKVRFALLHHFRTVHHAQSYKDLQSALMSDIDKSTLYRNLSSFEEVGIIHRIDDHSGISKYALGGKAPKGSEHAHFVCDRCETVYCLEASQLPELNVPEGFKASQVQTIVKGICAKC